MHLFSMYACDLNCFSSLIHSKKLLNNLCCRWPLLDKKIKELNERLSSGFKSLSEWI